MTPEELDNHLRKTITYIARHRATMTQQLNSDNPPGETQFRPRPPANLNAMEAADLEGAAIGNIALHCFLTGTIPPRPLTAIWVVNGLCKGITNRWQQDLPPLIDHLRTWHPVILQTEGIDHWIDQAEKIRSYSRWKFPNESEKWLTRKQAAELYHMSEYTIRDWGTSGAIRTIHDDNGPPLYLDTDIRTYLRVLHAQKVERAHHATQVRQQNRSTKQLTERAV